MKMKNHTKTNRLPKTYAELCRELMPRSIHDDIDLDNTREMVDALAVLPSRSAEQEDYLETLTQLIEAYEAQHAPVKAASGLEVLRYLMEQHGLAVADLGKILGKNSSLAYKILSGDRQITADHARSLARHFNVSAAVFVG